MYDIFTIADTKMPEGFLWGSGYAGHQVEGNNIHSNRWHNEQNYAEKSGLACNSYEMFETDIDLIHKLGHGAFRTSIEWSRIEPQEGMFDEKAAEHYVRLFAGLKEKGIKTFVTLVHFAIPQWFAEKNQFLDMENIKYFERYLEYIVPKIAPYADFWNVMNEFNLGDMIDPHPGEDKEFKMNCVKYHARGYHIIKKYSDAPVSSAHAFVQYMPYRPNDKADIAMTNYFDFKDNEFFFHAMRTGELLQPLLEGEFLPEIKNTVDFWSINMYVRTMIDARKPGSKGERYKHKKLNLINKQFYLDEFYPECIIANLTRLTDKPIYITENGCSCDDDRFRIVYLALYLSAIKEAIDMGADVRGYMHWALLDNYEWTSYIPKFGLCGVNFETFERIPKQSAWFYKDIIENNGVTRDIIRKYMKENPSLGI